MNNPFVVHTVDSALKGLTKAIEVLEDVAERAKVTSDVAKEVREEAERKIALASTEITRANRIAGKIKDLVA